MTKEERWHVERFGVRVPDPLRKAVARAQLPNIARRLAAANRRHDVFLNIGEIIFPHKLRKGLEGVELDVAIVEYLEMIRIDPCDYTVEVHDAEKKKLSREIKNIIKQLEEMGI